MTILDQIVADKRREIAAAKERVPEAKLRNALAAAPPIRDFFAALDGRHSQTGTRIRLIAEVKKASPSKLANDTNQALSHDCDNAASHQV